MKNPREAQAAWETWKLISELEAFLWEIYWDEFEEIYNREEAEKYWGQTVHEDQNPF
jgi:hypothetical protein